MNTNGNLIFDQERTAEMFCELLKIPKSSFYDVLKRMEYFNLIKVEKNGMDVFFKFNAFSIITITEKGKLRLKN